MRSSAYTNQVLESSSISETNFISSIAVCSLKYQVCCVQFTRKEDKVKKIDMENLVFLLLVLLPTCQSLLDCPEDDIERVMTMRDYPLTGNETIIYFSQKNNKVGITKFIVKCSKQQEEITMKIIQEGSTLTSIQLNGKDVEFTEFQMTNPTMMRLTHSEKILSSSILDMKGQWREMVHGTPLPSEQGNCTLKGESDIEYTILFCKASPPQARANLWYLLLLPVFVILFVVLYLKRKALLKLYHESGSSPADNCHMNEGMSYGVRRDVGSPEADTIKTRCGPSDQGDESQTSQCRDIGEYTVNSIYGCSNLQEHSPCEENGSIRRDPPCRDIGECTVNSIYGLSNLQES
ncbi:uncharacterized protein LOC143033363 [Oratosquilla oratoria]|uniref:uncharacterized protein LOC143033363 n=1 Tax=Oratosquilla oratoria TaxID=337810 RepID=UPI003F75BF3A